MRSQRDYNDAIPLSIGTGDGAGVVAAVLGGTVPFGCANASGDGRYYTSKTLLCPAAETPQSREHSKSTKQSGSGSRLGYDNEVHLARCSDTNS
jgi:hypothetical protein